jgi:type IV secretory pathway VirB10-like protein
MVKLKGFFSSLFKNKKIFIPIALLIVGVAILFSARLVMASKNKPKGKAQTKQASKDTKQAKPDSEKNNSKKSAPADKKQAKSSDRPKPPSLATVLDKAKKAGRLSDEQVKKIEAKSNELKKFNDSLKNKDDSEQTKLAYQKKRELRGWAKQNDIPTYFINFLVAQ